MSETKEMYSAKAAEKAFRASYEGRMCPILSAGGVKIESPLLTNMGTSAPTAPQGEVMGCQGLSCMWLIITGADAAGNPTSGACAAALLPSAVLQCRDALATVLPKETH